jgi:hypothetical protein
MHGLGKALELSVIRDGKNIGPISRQPLYDYNHQTIIPAQMVKTLKRGDGFHISCVWDTSKKQYWSFWGDGTDDEMCITVVFYYPKQYQNGGGSLAACQNSQDNALNWHTKDPVASWRSGARNPAVPGIRGWVDDGRSPTEKAKEACDVCNGPDDAWMEMRPEMDLCDKCKNISVTEYRPAEVARLQGAGGACQALVHEGHCPSCITTECPEGEVERFLLMQKPEWCALDGPVCSLAKHTADVVACYSVTSQLRNGMDDHGGVGFHPSDRLAIWPKRTKPMDEPQDCPAPKNIADDMCTTHSDCEASEYCALSKAAPFLQQALFPARRCEACYRCCEHQDAAKENADGMWGRCPDTCQCKETVISCQRKSEPSVFCVSSGTCVPEASDDDTKGCAACPDPRDVIFTKQVKACLPCEDNDDIFARLMSRLPGSMGSMFGDHCQESICVIFRTMFGSADGGGGDMMFMLDTMLNSTCPAVCTPCAPIVAKRSAKKYGTETQQTTSTSEPVGATSEPVAAALGFGLPWFHPFVVAAFHMCYY